MSLTAGSLNVTPLRINTYATLQGICDAAGQFPPSLSTHTAGWGSAYDPNGPLGSYGVTPAVTAPYVDAENFGAVAVRFYRFVLDDQRRRDLGLTIGAPEAYALRGVDVVFAQSRVDGYLCAYLLSHNANENKSHTVPALLELVRSVDPDATLIEHDNDQRAPSPDLFLWMVARLGEEIASGLELDRIRNLASVHAGSRRTAMSAGVDTTRPEFLSLVAIADADFGPIKVKVVRTAERTTYDFELGSNGNVSVHVGETFLTELITRDEKGPRAFFDVVLQIVPDIIATYNDDVEWEIEGRDRFVRASAQQLTRARIHATLPSPHPDKTVDFLIERLGFSAAESGQQDIVTLGAVDIEVVEGDAATLAFDVVLSDANRIREGLITDGYAVSNRDDDGTVRFTVIDGAGVPLTIRS